ncbi:uncharacterized protein FIBRA_02359 [Fibroporia radiculosa]|uniref:Spc7 kinetochore protein domain-containing protein n=1 Tax=Fibroporia radiculosa TaxID=599839 RepID=J4H1T4_9APHY|nr:uncharacterized protein FIBRA_02359 [Fibroporia radiculosa]CCM00329.1 predicted protein [Fibroporia radiculosa]
MANKISPNRRRSIAVLSQGQTSRHSHRRRAYSIAPGEKLSPAAKTRRSLAPRKSILKATASLPDSTESSADDNNTQSMDFTEVHNNSRKSLGRRVSFASHAHVRLFEREQKGNNSTGSSSSPTDDSPGADRNDEESENIDSNASNSGRRSSVRRSSVAFSEFGERSMDLDMDDTAPLPQDFLKHNQYQSTSTNYVTNDDEFTDEEEDDDEDMEITEAIRLNIERKRSLSLGQGRVSLPPPRRSSVVPLTSSQGHSENQLPSQQPLPRLSLDREPHAHDQDEDPIASSVQSESFMSEGLSGDDSQPVEFIIPISRSLRPPEPPSDAWLQLRAMTHAGDEPYETPAAEDSYEEPGPSHQSDAGAEEGETMEFTEAMGRVVGSRPSFALPPPSDLIGESSTAQPEDSLGGNDPIDAKEQPFQDDSFTSTEDSFADDVGADHTVNMTSLIRASLGTQDSSMEVTGIYSGSGEDEGVVKVPLTASKEKPAAPALTESETHPIPDVPVNDLPAASSVQAVQLSVFTAPNSSRPSVFSAPGSKTPAIPPRSPSKIPLSVMAPKPFSFSLSRSSASSSSVPAIGKVATTIAPQSPVKHQARTGTAAFAPPSARKSPMKRPAPPAAESAHQPSPTKRAAIGKHEPIKKAPFGKPISPARPQGIRRTSMIRRPSGYFAQRKSLGTGALPPAGSNGSPANNQAESPTNQIGQGARPGRARASLGIVPTSQDFVFDPGANAGNTGEPLYPDVSRIIREDPPTPSRSNSPAPAVAKVCEREAFRQAIATPSPTRGSPSPASPQPNHISPAIARSISSTTIGPEVHTFDTVAPTTEVPLDITELAPSHEIGPMKTPVNVVTAAEQWRDEVGEEAAAFDDEGPPISIEQFFAMTGIRFMDELTMPKPRQSIAPPPQLRSRSRRRSSTELSTELEDDPVPLAEFAVTMAVDLPRLELFTAVANDLGAWIEDSKKICLQAEKETDKVTPELFRDFVSADDSEKALLIHQLKLIKANNYGTAKSQWYDWKMDWTERLYGRAQQAFSNLESDAQTLAKIVKQAQENLPDLRQEYAQVMAELEREQANIAEIENSDQDYLNELKATISEQSTELEIYRTDVSEGRLKLERMEEKLAEIEEQKRETSHAIAQAQHVIHIQKESTSVEVFRLKDELEALQALHLWQITTITADVIVLFYNASYEVTVPCVKHRPNLWKATVSRTQHARTRERDVFPHFTDLTLRAAQQLLSELPEEGNVRKIVERLGGFWSSCAQVRSQFTFLAIKYPLLVEVVSPVDDGILALHAKATVLFPAAKGKAFISFIFDSKTFSAWPMSIGSLKADVEVAYGRIQRDVILDAVMGRLSQATPADSHGCLLDACIEATERYE